MSLRQALCAVAFGVAAVSAASAQAETFKWGFQGDVQTNGSAIEVPIDEEDLEHYFLRLVGVDGGMQNE